MKESESTSKEIDKEKIPWRKQEEDCCASPDPGLIPPNVMIRSSVGNNNIQITVSSSHECGIQWWRFVIQIARRNPDTGQQERWALEMRGDDENPQSQTTLVQPFAFGDIPTGAPFPVPFEHIDNVIVIASAMSTCGIVGHGVAQLTV
ncbi:MAG: hypothetical protein DHS20C01_15000 [marine bacterium B5-7]|nr:MAG: hypothetical protein DHS20C01_15000 [marine bacterium B5-7]